MNCWSRNVLQGPWVQILLYVVKHQTDKPKIPQKKGIPKRRFGIFFFFLIQCNVIWDLANHRSQRLKMALSKRNRNPLSRTKLYRTALIDHETLETTVASCRLLRPQWLGSNTTKSQNSLTEKENKIFSNHTKAISLKKS